MPTRSFWDNVLSGLTVWESVKNVNDVDERGRTLLYVAARAGNMKFVQKALEGKAQVNQCNKVGKHALYAAARGGNAEIVELFAAKGATVDLRNEHERTPLWAACFHGNTSAMRSLIKLGADPNAQDATFVSPLIAAASRGHNDTVSELITAAGDKLDLNLTEVLGCTPLWAAAEGGHKDVVLTLMAAGADTNVPNNFGRTALIAAALQGNTELCLALMARGADVNLGDEDGETPLYVAAFEDKAETVEALLTAAAADINKAGFPLRSFLHALEPPSGCADGRPCDEGNKEGNTPLIGACWQGNAKAVAALLKRHPDLERVNEDGRTALIASCWKGNHACTKLLLDAGALVNTVDLDGRSALWAAARAGDADSVALCVRHGGDLKLMDNRRDAFSAGAGVANCTPLFAAVWQEETAAVAALLEAGADPNLGDAEGRTPLSVVSSGGTAKHIKELLEKYVEETANNPELVKVAQEEFERRSAMQAKQAALFAEKIAKAEAEAEANAARRQKQLEEVNAALDALKTATEAARVAQTAVNGVGLAEGAERPTAAEVAAAVEAADVKRREVLGKLKLTSITADDLAAGDLRKVRKSVTGRLSVAAGKHEQMQSLEAHMADLKAGGDGKKVSRASVVGSKMQ